MAKTRRKRNLSAGAKLLRLRLRAGLTMRDVQSQTKDLARRLRNQAFRLGISRLSQYEAQGVIPNIHAMYSMARIYRRPMAELMRWYGIPI